MPDARPVGPGAAAALVERSVRAVVGQEWEPVESTLARSIVGDGPFGDDFEGLEDSMRFLSRTMPAPPGYAMAIDRASISIRHAPANRAARAVGSAS